MSARWQLKHQVKEDHNREVYGMAFNDTASHLHNLLATAGGEQVSVYSLDPETHALTLLHAYIVDKGQETFYVVKWMRLSDDTSVIVAAGDRGPIHVIDTASHKRATLLLGHGNSVNDVETHPTEPDLLLSCSKDESIRLWDVKRRVPLIVFSGNDAHGGEVLFVSFHGFRDMVFASSGMDDAVKIWSWKGRQPFLEHAGMAADVACQIETPLFSSTALHSDYVDCIHWYGDVLISKSVDNRLVMWRPAVDMDTLVLAKVAPQTAFMVLREFDIPNCSLWYIRFALNEDCTQMACGNRTGGIHVWNLDDDSTGTSNARVQCRASVPVRIVQFHAGSRHLVAGLEDGTVCVYATSGERAGDKDGASSVGDEDGLLAVADNDSAAGMKDLASDDDEGAEAFA